MLFSNTEGITPEEAPFTRDPKEFAGVDLSDLCKIVDAVQPTIMVGTSTNDGAFTKEVVQTMQKYAPRPIIFPLSNPTEKAEAKAEDLIHWTDGKALVATGIPSDYVLYKGVNYAIGEANNALIYPGLGLGSIAVNSRLVADEMISKAAHSLGGIVDVDRPGAAVIPPVAKLLEFSETVAIAVAEETIALKLNNKEVTDVKAAIAEIKWELKY